MPPLPNERASHHPDALAAAGSRAGTQKTDYNDTHFTSNSYCPGIKQREPILSLPRILHYCRCHQCLQADKTSPERGYYQGNSATTSNESDVNPEEYGYTTEQGETLFDDVKPEDDEVEYKIIGTNHRDLSKKDIGYSENFYLKATKEVKEDKYAVEIYNERGRLAGYLDRDLNRFWHKLLMKANPENPVMQCRGFIGQFRNDRDELKFYGKVYLPEVDETDPDYKRIMNG